MKVTDLKQQAHNSDRVSVYLDNKYAFSISLTDLSSAGIKVGDSLSKQDLAKLQQLGSQSKAIYQAMKLLSYRARSNWEITSYLDRKGYSPTIIDQVTKDLTRLGYVNDADFARDWIKYRTGLKQLSLTQLKFELRQKRVSDEVINEVLEHDPVDEIDNLRILINKKRTQTKYKDDLKLMRYLSSKGYSYDKIKQALGR